jgi:hypothetical protein
VIVNPFGGIRFHPDYFHSGPGKFTAVIRTSRRAKHTELFDTLDEAVAALAAGPIRPSRLSAYDYEEPSWGFIGRRETAMLGSNWEKREEHYAATQR